MYKRNVVYGLHLTSFIQEPHIFTHACDVQKSKSAEFLMNKTIIFSTENRWRLQSLVGKSQKYVGNNLGSPCRCQYKYICSLSLALFPFHSLSRDITWEFLSFSLCLRYRQTLEVGGPL